MYRLSTLGRAAALGAAACLVALAACQQTRDVVAPIVPPAAANPIFQSYVAIGNSITAGFQSNGINDSTQRQSYERLLAASMGTRYRYPSLGMPGCPPPIANGLTGGLVGGPTAPSCSGRTFNTDTSEILTNVAVPGARVLDPISIFLTLTRRNLMQQSLRYLTFGEGETGLLVYSILLKYWAMTPEDDVRPFIFLMSE